MARIDWERQIGRRLKLRDLHVFLTVAQLPDRGAARQHGEGGVRARRAVQLSDDRALPLEARMGAITALCPTLRSAIFHPRGAAIGRGGIAWRL